MIAEARAAGVATLSGIANALTVRGVPTPSGRGAWSPATVMRLDRRVQAAWCRPDALVSGARSRGLTLIADPPTPCGWHYRAPHARHRRPCLSRGGVFDEMD